MGSLPSTLASIVSPDSMPDHFRPYLNAGSVVLRNWIGMCASNVEFVANYNRLRGARISFAAPKRTAFEALIDATCNHVPMAQNDDAELMAFWEFCLDALSRLSVEPEPAKAGAGA